MAKVESKAYREAQPCAAIRAPGSLPGSPASSIEFPASLGDLARQQACSVLYKVLVPHLGEDEANEWVYSAFAIPGNWTNVSSASRTLANLGAHVSDDMLHARKRKQGSATVRYIATGDTLDAPSAVPLEDARAEVWVSPLWIAVRPTRNLPRKSERNSESNTEGSPLQNPRDLCDNSPMKGWKNHAQGPC